MCVLAVGRNSQVAFGGTAHGKRFDSQRRVRRWRDRRHRHRAAGGVAHARCRAGPSRYNVLLITLDTTRADHLHCYGYGRETSPNLDTLAADGVRFDCAISASAITPISHASILTGLNPDRHGLRVFYGIRGCAPGHAASRESSCRRPNPQSAVCLSSKRSPRRAHSDKCSIRRRAIASPGSPGSTANPAARGRIPQTALRPVQPKLQQDVVGFQRGIRRQVPAPIAVPVLPIGERLSRGMDGPANSRLAVFGSARRHRRLEWPDLRRASQSKTAHEILG